MNKKTAHFLNQYLKECKGRMAGSILLSVLSVLIGFVPYIAVYRLIASFVSGHATLHEIIILSLCCVAGYGIKLLFFEFSTTLSHQIAYKTLEKIRKDISNKLLKLPMGYVLDQPVGKLKNLIIDQTEMIELPLAHLIPEGIAYILAPLAVFGLLLWVHPIMAMASVLSFVVGMLISSPMMKNMGKNYDAYMASGHAMNSTIVEYIEGIEVIKTFNQSNTSYQKFTRAINDFKELTLHWFQSTWVGGNLMTSIMPSTLLGVLPIGMILYKKDNLLPEELMLTIILSMALIAPLMGLTTYFNSLKMIQYAAEALNEVLDEKELPEAALEAELHHFDISFEDVSFSYHAKDDRTVIDHLSFTIPEGTFTALIGPSGGGKSTVAKLISRFWDVNSGVIRLGGYDIRAIPLAQLSHCISYVAQDNYLFNCSLKENIRLGNPDATDEQVYAAAKAAMCHEFIQNMEHGYDTSAGEAGSKLSGGEKQRIAIARMILRNAPIVVLDEATAYTDPQNEEKIQQAISNLTKGKTLLVIAHRLSTIRHADNIMILSEGKIKEMGTHENLLASSIAYKRMWDAHIGAKNRSVQGEV